MFDVKSLTDRGLKRELNEDALLVDRTNNVFVVSDGMGGYDSGEIASAMIIDCFKEVFCSFDEDSTLPGIGLDDLNSRLNSVIKISTNHIMNYAHRNLITTQMGATVAGLYQNDSEDIVVFHLGDSRVYRVREKRIERLTTDHSLYEEKKAQGMREDELAKIGRNKITKAVGNFNAFSLEINSFPLKDSDYYLLCSDGVSDLCSDEEILESVMKEPSNLEKVCEDIKKMVYARGAKDNLTIIVLKYTKGDRACY